MSGLGGVLDVDTIARAAASRARLGRRQAAVAAATISVIRFFSILEEEYSYEGRENRAPGFLSNPNLTSSC